MVDTEKASSNQKLKTKEIRVFVSSTFRDMHEEREHLIKSVFPQLRKLCEERGVTWGEVDLRWGITDEEKAEGRVLSICLDEIDRCRPFFIGLLGERYGWIPSELPQELIQRNLHIGKDGRKSVTEIEMAHGVLNNPELAKHAFFYFRDPAYIGTLTPSEQVAYCAENPEACKKLDSLKASIIATGLPVRQNYSTPKNCAHMVINDLTAVIEEQFPASSMTDPLERESMAHEAYLKSRLQVYVSQPQSYDQLDNHVKSTNQPLVVLGESGSGKSALLANWAHRHHRINPEVPIFKHFIGASAIISDWSSMMRRLIGDINRYIGVSKEIPSDPNELRAEFASAIQAVSAKGRTILLLDGLNQLEDRQGALDLTWLPSILPANLRLFVSTLPGRPLDELQKRGCTTLTVSPLSAQERKQLILEYLQPYRKALPQSQLEMLGSAPQCSNPFYLRAVLEELRVYGVHERVQERLHYYLQAQTISELFNRILERYETDYNHERPNLVQDAMMLLWAARRGLAEAELLDMLGSNGTPLPRAHFSPFFLAVVNALINHSGLLGFSHEHLRQAVQQRYLKNEEAQSLAHLRIADYFKHRGPIPRTVDELPWQLIHAKAWDQLHKLLAYPAFFVLFYRTSHADALNAWTELERKRQCRMVDTYSAVLRKPANHANEIIEVIAHLLELTGHWSELFEFRQKLTAHYLNTNDTKRLTANILGLASLLVNQGHLDEALQLLTNQDEQLWQEQDLWLLIDYLRIKSMALWQKGDLDEAVTVLKNREKLCRNAAGYEHQLSGTLVHQSFILQLRGEEGAAEQLLEEARKISREADDLGGYQSVVGEIGLLLLNNGNPNGAMEKFAEQERICRELGDLSSLAGCLGNQAAVYSTLGHDKDEMAKLKEMEDLANGIGHQTLYHVSLSSQAGMLYRTQQAERAKSMNDAAIDFFRAQGLTERLATALLLRGHIRSYQMDPEQADQAYEEGYSLFQKLSSPREISESMRKAGQHFLGIILDAFQSTKTTYSFDEFERQTERQEKALSYLDYAQKHLVKAIETNPDNAKAHQVLGKLLGHRADTDGAIASYRRALELNPQRTYTSVRLAELLFNKSVGATDDPLQEAVALLEKAVTIEPEDMNIRIKLIYALTKSGRFREVVHHFLEFINVQPEWTQSHFDQLITLTASQYGSQVRSAAIAMAEQDPNNAQVWYIIGMCSQLLDDQDQAVIAYRKGTNIDPTDAVLYNNLGNALAIAGNKDACIENQQKAISLSETFAEPHYVLGVLLMKAGKRKEAKKHLETFLTHAKPYLAKYRQQAEMQLSLLNGRFPGLTVGR